MKRILIVTDAPGPAEFIAPVIPFIKKYTEISVATVKESPTKILALYNPERCDNVEEADKIYKKIRPDALIIGVSSLITGPYVTNRFIDLAAKESRPIICFQDFWANHRWPSNIGMIHKWSAILTIDGLAKKFLLEDSFTGKIFVTGSPAFERFRGEDMNRERVKLREKFGVGSKDFVMLYCGTGTPAGWREDEATFTFFAKVMSEFQNEYPETRLIVRQHPRDEKPGRYQELAPHLNYLDTSSMDLTEELLPIADAVIGMYATNLIHACYLRIPGISILLPDAGKKRLQDNLQISDFPPNSMGATIGIYKEKTEDLKNALLRIKSDDESLSGLKAAQERFFVFDKKTATEKVAEAIQQILSF